MNRICSETPLISVLPRAKSKTQQHAHYLSSIKLWSGSANVLPTLKYTNHIQFQKNKIINKIINNKFKGVQDQRNPSHTLIYPIGKHRNLTNV
jgi:hypothetical protein